MKKILKFLISLIILAISAAIFYQYQVPIRANISPFLNRVVMEIGSSGAPCENPITYSLGTLDTKFGISQKYLLSALSDAEAIWEKPFGRELFTIKEGAVLKINLIYDFRQEATSKLSSLGITVQNNRDSYDSLKIKFTELKTKLATAKSDYEKRTEFYNERQTTYNQQVEFWNAQGGAPPDEFDKLRAEKIELDGQLSQLQTLQAQVNQSVSEINAVVVVLNRLATILNISVDDFNTTGATRGETFTEGVYQSDGIKAQIDIYEFSSREKLVRVLAHEFGHALGLAHVNDPKSIMYRLNQSSNIILTRDDLAALNGKCQTEQEK